VAVEFVIVWFLCYCVGAVFVIVCVCCVCYCVGVVFVIVGGMCLLLCGVAFVNVWGI